MVKYCPSTESKSTASGVRSKPSLVRVLSDSFDRELITALTLSQFSPRLFVGTHTGKIHILATPTLQAIRTLSCAPLEPGPVTFLSSTLFYGLSPQSSGHTNRKNFLRRPVETMARAATQSLWAEHIVQQKVHPVGQQFRWPGNSIQVTTDFSHEGARSREMASQNDRLREELQRAIQLNDSMWERVVNEVFLHSNS